MGENKFKTISPMDVMEMDGLVLDESIKINDEPSKEEPKEEPVALVEETKIEPIKEEVKEAPKVEETKVEPVKAPTIVPPAPKPAEVIKPKSDPVSSVAVAPASSAKAVEAKNSEATKFIRAYLESFDTAVKSSNMGKIVNSIWTILNYISSANREDVVYDEIYMWFKKHRTTYLAEDYIFQGATKLDTSTRERYQITYMLFNMLVDPVNLPMDLNRAALILRNNNSLINYVQNKLALKK